MWHIWRERNEIAYDGIYWHRNKLLHKMWLNMIDYGRLGWNKVQYQIDHSADNQKKKNKLINEIRLN